jgi:glycosyltransferase involved in cell wall biosynthesis
MTSLVTVVIPNFNGAKYLNDSINSVLAQDYTNIEIVVVDDGSTDESLAILERYGTKITFIKQRNKGSGAARNAGINLASGEYIALLDSDDIWKDNKIRIQISLLENGDYDLVYCGGQEFSAKLEKGLIHVPQYSGDCYQYFRRFPTTGIIELGCSTAVFRASVLKCSGLFDESFMGAAEDWDFFRRYAKFAKVGFSPEVLVWYRKHADSITARALSDYYEGNRRAIINMFREDKEIGHFEKRRVWLKFHLMIIKSNLKKFYFVESLKYFVKLFQRIL